MKASPPPRTALLALALALAAPVAFAQDDLEAGRRAYWEGRFEESIEILEPLLGRESDPTTLREACFFLGLDTIALGDEPRGRRYFESAVRHDPAFVPTSETFPPDVVATYLAVRDGLVGRLVVDSDPPGARLWVAGAAVGTTPYAGAVLAGDVLVRYELDGYRGGERRVTVRAGEESSVRVVLEPVATAAEAAPSAPAEPSSPSEPQTVPPAGGSSSGSGKTIGIVAGVAGGAGAALALAGGGGSDEPRSSGGGVGLAPLEPQQADIRVTIADWAVRDARIPGFRFELVYMMRVEEVAGVGASMNFIRLEPRLGGRVLERVEIGAGRIIAQTGSNRIEGHSAREFQISQNFNAAEADNALITVGFTDDNGNVLQAELVITVEPQ